RTEKATNIPIRPADPSFGFWINPSTAQSSQANQTAELVTGYNNHTTRKPQKGKQRPANHRPQNPSPQRIASRNMPRPANHNRAAAIQPCACGNGPRYAIRWNGSNTALWLLARCGAPHPTQGFQSGNWPDRISRRLNSSQGWNCRTGSISSRLAG